MACPQFSAKPSIEPANRWPQYKQSVTSQCDCVHLMIPLLPFWIFLFYLICQVESQKWCDNHWCLTVMNIIRIQLSFLHQIHQNFGGIIVMTLLKTKEIMLPFYLSSWYLCPLVKHGPAIINVMLHVLSIQCLKYWFDGFYAELYLQC